MKGTYKHVEASLKCFSCNHKYFLNQKRVNVHEHMVKMASCDRFRWVPPGWVRDRRGEEKEFPLFVLNLFKLTEMRLPAYGINAEIYRELFMQNFINLEVNCKKINSNTPNTKIRNISKPHYPNI